MNTTEFLEALAVPVYTTDASGRLTFYNDAAAQFWGHRPALGSERWCGAWRLFRSDGTELADEERPLAHALGGGEPAAGEVLAAERPDGTVLPIQAFPRVVRDKDGRVVGGINLLIDASERNKADIDRARLAAIVANSDDAIVSKTLDGIITTWNAGAERIFGYRPEEIIGRHIKTIIPRELHAEEDEIIAKLGRGERIAHFDTVRVTKDGRRIDISLTVSPLRDSTGRIVGASKVARDVTSRKRDEELQRLLFAELNHRVKNTLAMVQSIAAQSLRHAARPEDFVSSFNGRIRALGRAHDQLVQGKMQGAELGALLRDQVLLNAGDGARIACEGPAIMLDSRSAIGLALVLHELATNAHKYGALSVPEGRLAIDWKRSEEEPDVLILRWRESGGPASSSPGKEGFGTQLIRRSLEASGGGATFDYRQDGLFCEIHLSLPSGGHLDAIAPACHPSLPANEDGNVAAKQSAGARILVVEDEPLIAMDAETQLAAAGYDVVGPALSAARALELLETEGCDAALLDANLAGEMVDGVAEALRARGTPFAFATGYGREALPEGFEDVPILAKPYTSNQLERAVRELVKRVRARAGAAAVR